VLREASRGLAPGVSVVLISPRPGPRLLQEMDALRRRGVEVVHASPLSPVGTPGAVP
jgi:hypothetical protein